MRPADQVAREAADGEEPAAAPLPAPLPAPLVALGFLLWGLVGGLTATIEILLIPLRLGGTLIPVTIAFAVGGNFALPRLSRNLTRDTSGALPPVVGWIIFVAVFVSNRREGDVLMPGGGDVQWVSYGLMLSGLLAGGTSVLLLAGSQRRPA